ncbi:uncharacterized protein B0H18DRAFT_1034360 [Fomitopsis serialis]|uniref:uncharacterized protein n=1 Tax=Fomitopsis serialis TaxID=139415 RepID=UPI0020082191|nr:uncharacterized protein B0H18DRAFT_1034360 [Neoantrodia serialis]KAH9917492.1 hypothetical protein B0H18DRAFT_1034360 [Neoantrodia serialis]
MPASGKYNIAKTSPSKSRRTMASRKSRSHGSLCSSRCSLPPHTLWSHCQPTLPPMAHRTPRQMKSRVYTIRKHEALQTSEINMDGWRSEVDGKIVEMMIPIKEFLAFFVPSEAAVVLSTTENPFRVPVGGLESTMYEPLCVGLEAIVAHFPEKKRPCFYNNAHEPIKFPFLLAEQDQHATKPDVAKSTDKEDPMLYCSKVNDETLVQLSKSARNILVSQSRLFVFTVGIYGRHARIFRFDHAGAVCSPAFEYGSNNGTVLHEFFWRLVHPIRKDCDIVGADPSVRFPSEHPSNDVKEKLISCGVEFTNETVKACRWVTLEGADQGKDKKYLLYELIFINPRLFSRATMIWKALELDESGQPTGHHVVIKEAWRQLARESELTFHERIRTHVASQPAPPAAADEGSERMDEDAFMAAWNATWSGLMVVTLGIDLGEEEELHIEDEDPVGHRTRAGVHQCQGEHQWFERSHMRLVSDTIGTPISQFKRTKEMTQGLRDAIHGHQVAFEAGIMHRDVSEGNVMLVNGRGFLHDLDYGFDWKNFLHKLGYEDTIASWEQYVLTEKGIPRADVPAPAAEPVQPHTHENKGKAAERRAVINRRGEKEYFVEAILAERPTSNGKKYLVKWAGFGHASNLWLPLANVRNCVALSLWLSRPLEDRTRMSKQHSSNYCGDPEEPHEGARPNVVVTDAVRADDEKTRLECKQRTGTFYFMAIEVLNKKIIHQVRHDLESFYWLLVWLVLRHTRHSRGNTHDILKALFDLPSDETCAMVKIGWLMQSFRVQDNQPLSDLLRQFAQLCRENIAWEGEATSSPVTYERVLQIFDDALERNDWPEDDEAIPFKPADASDEKPARLERPWSALQSGQMGSQAQHSRGQLSGSLRNTNNVPSNSAAQLPPAQRQRGSGGGGLLATPDSGSRPAIASWASPPVFLPGLASPESPTPSSRRGTSSYSAALTLPMPVFDGSSGKSSGSSPDRSDGEQQEPTQGRQGYAASRSRSSRKRSQEDLIGADEDLAVGPSKRSRTHSELPRRRLSRGPTPER